MAATPSEMVPLGTPAPDFALPDPSGTVHFLEDFADAKGLLVVFMCNHCPFVIHVADELARLAKDAKARGIAVVGINANDVSKYPDDAPDKMAEEAERRGYDFPYLYDETQAVAADYHAACTPDFFLYDGERKLFYRGQLDDSRPSSDVPVTGADLRAAIDALLAGEDPPAEQKPSIGCNVKWRTPAGA